MLDLNRPDRFDRDVTLFYFAYRAFTSAADDALARHDMGRPHHRILVFVACSPGLSVGELCGTMGLTKQAINAPLRRLITHGLIEMRPSERDRRRKELYLSAEGAELERSLHARQRELFQEALGEAGPAAAEGWRAFMAALAGSGWAAFSATLDGRGEPNP
ncbi:MarR family winged helix-turn-helix transcriptional regulator [Streptomyces sp. NPDC102462]|uniref:MarR family winged helix-turn-helix transcriptional regulator n=1 Tax=Streptomyces sp. NPDC102462 TaxID=3366178 RepID=UPI003802FB3C